VKNRGETFTDRLETAAKAKQELLEKARAKDQDLSKDPEFLARQAARVAAANMRADREAERQIAKQAERAKVAAEREARNAERLALEAAEAARITAEAERKRVGKRPVSVVPLSPAEQKAARDARYAARKARKK
jgi:hypothetical protein